MFLGFEHSASRVLPESAGSGGSLLLAGTCTSRERLCPQVDLTDLGAQSTCTPPRQSRGLDS